MSDASKKRNETLVILGAVEMMCWYSRGYEDASKGEDNWMKVPPRFPEDRGMYWRGQDHFKAGKPNAMLEAIK